MTKKNKLRKNYILISIVAILLIGIIWQIIMVEIDKKSISEVGEYVDVGAYQAHYYSKGNGDVAFVFITGSGTPCAYTDFYALQNMLSTEGQTVTFDHAGSGWSTNTESPRTIENLVNELSVLIDSVVQEKPVILICHSLGSLEAISYAQINPEKVAGIIFLDSGTPEFYSNDSELFAKVINRSSAFIRTIGVNRLLGELGVLLPLYGENSRNKNLPESIKALDKAMFYKFTGNSASLNTIKQMNQNATSILSGPSLGDTPILILSSDSGDEWNAVQVEMTSWSENSEQVTIDHSEHYLYWSNFDEVSNYIKAFVEKIKN